MKNTKKQQGTAKNPRKKGLILAIFICLAVLILLYSLTEFVLPSFEKNIINSNKTDISQTKIFYLPQQITPEKIALYDKFVTDIHYKANGNEVLITDNNFYEVGGNDAVMFANYINAIKSGDKDLYSACFSERYDFENGIDRFASGNEDFPPQMLYDIYIEELDKKYDKNTGFNTGLFCITYRIYLNTGDFRTDITDDTAPLIFVTTDNGTETKITDIFYRYNP